MSERKRFVAAALSGEKSMAAICREFGISRKTGYKWLQRAKNGESLEDQSHAPFIVPGRTPPEVEALVLNCRAEHPAWGPRKLLRNLQDRGYTDLPCKSTVGNILLRNGFIPEEVSEAHTPWQRFQREAPNELWQLDFKGDFEILNGQRCYPLDATDDHSRSALCLKAMENIQYASVYPVLMDVFRENGLPDAILCDNGKPWGDSKKGITVFDVWMMQLNILPIHGRPLHPQTQGKLERFHRTMKEELLQIRPMRDLEDAQKAFDEWRWCYNNERPHEALGMDCPAKHYKRSNRSLPERLKEPEYNSGTSLRRVNYKGYISIHRKRYYLTEALIGKLLAIREEDGTAILSYGTFDVASIDLRNEELLSKHICRKENV